MRLTVRAARQEDGEGIACVHVDIWRTAYIGILPKLVLDNLSYEKSTCDQQLL